MEITEGVPRVGAEAIRSLFTAVTNRPRDDDRPTYVRHMTATHQIDLLDTSTAKGRCYFLVLTDVGLDHWGRYLDDYRTVDGVWKFARRQVTTDGRSPNSLFQRSE
jgi:hypothetical protein